MESNISSYIISGFSLSSIGSCLLWSMHVHSCTTNSHDYCHIACNYTWIGMVGLNGVYYTIDLSSKWTNSWYMVWSYNPNSYKNYGSHKSDGLPLIGYHCLTGYFDVVDLFSHFLAYQNLICFTYTMLIMLHLDNFMELHTPQLQVVHNIWWFMLASIQPYKMLIILLFMYVCMIHI